MLHSLKGVVHAGYWLKFLAQSENSSGQNGNPQITEYINRENVKVFWMKRTNSTCEERKKQLKDRVHTVLVCLHRGRSINAFNKLCT